MDKPLLKLGFIDYFKPIDDFFIEILSRQFHIERNDQNPDYVIFCDKNFGQQNVKFNDRRVVKIFFTGENARPFEYHCHHAISFEHLESNQFYRLPLYVIDNWVNTTRLNLSDISKVVRNSSVSEKIGFCSFVVKNGGCEERNRIFRLISEYKKVDSGGPLFKNTDELKDGPGLGGFHYSKRNFLQKRKFNICYENSSYPGYVTEKLFHALTYNTVPIYWGSPTVEVDFNPDAFICRHYFESDNEMVKRIIELDNNDDLYNEILRQPILNPRNKTLDLDRFVSWFKNNVYRGVLNS